LHGRECPRGERAPCGNSKVDGGTVNAAHACEGAASLEDRPAPVAAWPLAV